MFHCLRSASRSVVLAAFLAAVLACMPFSMTAAATASRGDVVVATVHGTVSATMAGMTVPLSAGAILQLPATVRTGADGAVELRQGNSTFAAAGNTELEIPQSAAEDGLVERIIQVRGNAFYNIGKRTGTRLRVETPYLVAVIKGTQFNVAAQDDSTTIALFEGHLEVRASDDSDVIDLDAGEIAIRRRNDVSISVLRLNAARGGDTRRNPELAARQQADSPTSDSGTTIARNGDSATAPRVNVTTTDSIDLGNAATPTERDRIVDTLDTDSTIVAKNDVVANLDVSGGNVATTANVGLDTGPVSADVGPRLSVDVPAGAVDVGVGASVGVGEVASVDAGVGAAIDLSAGTVAASTDVALDVGPVSTDVGAAAAVDVTAGTADIDVGASVATADVVTVDTSVAAAADLPAGTVDVGVDTSVAAVGLPVDVGASAAVDAGAGTVDVGLDTSLAGADVGAAVGVDVGSGVSADVGVGPVDVGLDVGSGGIDLDLGLGASDDSAGGGGLLGGLGGLLGGRKRD
jgi:hypothetical protein